MTRVAKNMVGGPSPRRTRTCNQRNINLDGTMLKFRIRLLNTAICLMVMMAIAVFASETASAQENSKS